MASAHVVALVPMEFKLPAQSQQTLSAELHVLQPVPPIVRHVVLVHALGAIADTICTTVNAVHARLALLAPTRPANVVLLLILNVQDAVRTAGVAIAMAVPLVVMVIIFGMGNAPHALIALLAHTRAENALRQLILNARDVLPIALAAAVAIALAVLLAPLGST